MNVDDARRILSNMFVPLMKPRGFKRKGISFQRILPDRVEEISFGVYKDQRGKIRFSFGVGICFQAVEALLNPDLEKLIESSTIGVPIHFLHPGKEYFDCEIDESTDLSKLTNAVFLEIKDYIFPFLSKYSDLETVRLSLKSDDPKDWFVLTPEQRITKWAAIEYVQGNTATAISMLEQALGSLTNALPKHRFPLEKLLKVMRNKI